MPKEVVIAADASKSMTGVCILNAIHSVLESLGSTDRVLHSLKQYIIFSKSDILMHLSVLKFKKKLRL